MRKLIKVFVVALFVAFANTSCTSEVTYEAPQFEEKQPKEIRVLNDEYMFRYGGDPMVVDSLLITSTANSDNHIAVFNRYTGDLVKEFGRKGPGPNELVRPTTFSVDKLNSLLYVYDWGKQSLIQYDLHKMSGEEIPEYNSIKVSGEFVKSAQMRFLKDSLFYASSLKDGRISVGGVSEVQDVIQSESPDLNKFPTQEDWYIYMNGSVMAVRPDGRYLAAASSLGGILEIFDLNKKERVVLKHFYEPIFEKKGHVIRPLPETIGGFMCLAATDKYLYATLHGKANPTSMPMAICKFDWKGNPIDRFDCGKYPISSFTVTEDDRTAYALAVGDEGEHILLKIEF